MSYREERLMSLAGLDINILSVKELKTIFIQRQTIIFWVSFAMNNFAIWEKNFNKSNKYKI